MSPWWLFLIIPFSIIGGMSLSSLFGANKQGDQCANCQYNCMICPLKEKETK